MAMYCKPISTPHEISSGILQTKQWLLEKLVLSSSRAHRNVLQCAFASSSSTMACNKAKHHWRSLSQGIERILEAGSQNTLVQIKKHKLSLLWFVLTSWFSYQKSFISQYMKTRKEIRSTTVINSYNTLQKGLKFQSNEIENYKIKMLGTEWKRSKRSLQA